jgi:type IV pilus assembly protein PilX
MHPLARLRPRRTARGFSLIVILLMTIVLAFLALGAMNTSIVQERMAGQAADRNVAMQAAEATLLDAEAHVEQVIASNTPFTTACDDGLCLSRVYAGTPSSRPVWDGVVDLSTATNTIGYGAATGARELPNLANQPRYVIERLGPLPPEEGDDAQIGAPPTAQAYRITARAGGQQESTSVTLQSNFVKRQ